MAIKTLYISHQNFDWTTFKTDIVFVKKKNINNYIKHKTTFNCYTSLEDLEIKLDEIDKIPMWAETIQLVDLDLKTGFKNVPDQSMYLYVEFFKTLSKIKNSDKIQNFNIKFGSAKELFSGLAAPRKTNDNCLWVSGCSITHGAGVDLNSRYASLLEKKLNIPTVMLTKSGSSIAWQSDQLLRSDLKEGDTVIWGLTSFNRINYAQNFTWRNATILDYMQLPKEKQYYSIDYFDSVSLSMACIKNILQVSNFCKKIKAKLYLINIIGPGWLDFVFGNDENYLDLTVGYTSDGKGDWLDLGYDQDHPGPLQHREYATRIYDFIKGK